MFSYLTKMFCLTLEIKRFFRCYEAKIEESEKAGSHWELNPGHLACTTNALPLSYINWTALKILYMYCIGGTEMLPLSRAVATGPVSPVSTGPLFPSPMACLASPNRANARQTPMARTQHGDMLQHNTRWLRTVQRPSLPTIFRSSNRTICEGCGL